jgi:hypothetical protein
MFPPVLIVNPVLPCPSNVTPLRGFIAPGKKNDEILPIEIAKVSLLNPIYSGLSALGYLSWQGPKPLSEGILAPDVEVLSNPMLVNYHI